MFQSGDAIFDIDYGKTEFTIKPSRSPIKGSFASKNLATCLFPLVWQGSVRGLSADTLDGVHSFAPSWGDEFLTPLLVRFDGRVTMMNTSNPSVKLTLSMLKRISGSAFKTN